MPFYKEYNRKILEQSNKILKYEKSYSSIVQYERKKVEACVNSGGEDIENILQHYYESMLLLKNEWLYNEEKIIEKSTAITTIISKLEEENNSKYYDWMKKLAKINIDEFKETEKCLLNVLDQKYKEKDEEIHYLMLLRNYNYAIQIINKN